MKHFVKSLPVLSILLALACDILLPDSVQHPAAEHPYFTWALLIGLAVYVIALLISLGNTKVRDKLSYSALFYAGAVLVLNILNLLTAKFAILPVLYFPSLDRVFGVLVEDSAFLATCLAYSARLLFFGWLGGAVVGVLTGIAIGLVFGCAVFALVMLKGDVLAGIFSTRPRARPNPVHRVDSVGTHRFPDCGFRQCLPDCAGCVVPDYRAHQQRHRFHPQLVL